MPYSAILLLIGLGRLTFKPDQRSRAKFSEIKDSSFTSEFLAAEARQKESYNVCLSFHTFQS